MIVQISGAWAEYLIPTVLAQVLSTIKN